MKVDCLALGAYQTNCYIVRSSEEAEDCLVIDTGLDEHTHVDFLGENNLNPKAVIFTHGHCDHIFGLISLRERFSEIKVYIHEQDAAMLTGDPTNLAALAGAVFSTEPADVLLSEGDVVAEAGIELSVLHTPGHTLGGISLHCEADGIVFAGDTLFAESVGRSDFPGGSATQLTESIRQKLFSLSDETVVYPGHGPSTTIGHEKKHNPFL